MPRLNPRSANSDWLRLCCVLAGTLGWAGPVAGATADPHALINAAADQLNAIAPQAVANQTLDVGVFDGANKTFTSGLPEFFPGNMTEAQAQAKGIQPQHRADLNSWNMTYRVRLSGTMPSGLKVALQSLTSSAQVAQEIAGTVNLSAQTATVNFHPGTSAVQRLSITWDGGGTAAALWPHLQEQLGAFVVPNLLVAIVYEPPGGASWASYERTSTTGTVVSWGFARTSGIVDTENPDQLSDYFVQGMTAGIGALGADKAGSAIEIINGLKESHEVTTTTETTSANSTANGTYFSMSDKTGTTLHQYPGRGDVFVVLQDVLFVYLVQNGKVHLAPTNYAGMRKVSAADLQALVPPAVYNQAVALDCMLTGHLPGGGAARVPVAGVGSRLALGGGQRFMPFATWTCEHDSWSDYTLKQSDFTTTTHTETSTTTVVDKVSGLAASIGGEGDTTYGTTYTSSNQQVTGDDVAATVHLECAPDEQPFSVQVYYDTIFRTFVCVKGAPVTQQAMMSGTTNYDSDAIAPHQQIQLKVGGSSYSVFSDDQGRFSFPFADMPKGQGVFTVAGRQTPVTFDGSPRAGLKVRVPGGLAGPAATAPASVPAASGPGAAVPSGPAMKTPIMIGGPAPTQPFEILANPALKGRLGGLVIAYPEGHKADSTQVRVFGADGQKKLLDFYGAGSRELLPGQYTVEVGGRKVSGVTIQSRMDTRLRVGVLHLNAGGNTKFTVYASDGTTKLTDGYGEKEIGLPAGTYKVEIAGQQDSVTVEDGKVAEF